CIDMLLSEYFFFSSRRRHTRFSRDWSSDVCSSDLAVDVAVQETPVGVDHTQDVAAEPEAVLERLAQHFRAAVDADGLEALLEQRSEERRVGKECSSRRLRSHVGR